MHTMYRIRLVFVPILIILCIGVWTDHGTAMPWASPRRDMVLAIAEPYAQPICLTACTTGLVRPGLNSACLEKPASCPPPSSLAITQYV
jgi:hypothetical protein